MNEIERYLDIKESENRNSGYSVDYLREIKQFCENGFNKSKLNQLPSTGQLEYLKLQPNFEKLFNYIIHQAEKRTNASWNVIVRDQNSKERKFYEFLVARIYEIYKNSEGNVEARSNRVKCFLEYLSDMIKLRREL